MFQFKKFGHLNLILVVALGFGFINPEDILFGFDLQFLDLYNPENTCTKQFVIDFSIGSFRYTLMTKGILELVSQSRIGFGIGEIKNPLLKRLFQKVWSSSTNRWVASRRIGSR